MLQSSLSLFSIGVPVSANLALLLISFTAFAAAVVWFLMYCASSIISYSKTFPSQRLISLFNRSQEVTSTSTFCASYSSIMCVLSSCLPVTVTTFSEGANFASSSPQLNTRDAGEMTIDVPLLPSSLADISTAMV